jgi:hypothetical protein
MNGKTQVWNNWAPKFAENVTLPGRDNSRCFELIPNDQVHPSEREDDGSVLWDEWKSWSPVPHTIELVVACPEWARRGGKLVFLPQYRRKYHWTGDRTQVQRIPRRHRAALWQVQHGRITGGLFPQGELVGEPAPEFSELALANLTNGRTPWKPPPGPARTAAEQCAARSAHELNEMLLAEIDAEDPS